MTTETELRNATVAVTSGRLLAMSREMSHTLPQLPWPVQKILTLTLSAISWRETPPDEICLPLSSLRLILGPETDLSSTLSSLPASSQIMLPHTPSASRTSASQSTSSSAPASTPSGTPSFCPAPNQSPGTSFCTKSNQTSAALSPSPTRSAIPAPAPLFTAAELCPKQNTVRLTLNPALSHHFGPLSRNFVTYLSTDLFSLPSPAAAALYRDLRTRCNTTCENTRLFTPTDLTRLALQPRSTLVINSSDAGASLQSLCASLSHCRMLQIIPQNNALPYRPVTRQGRLIGWEIKWTVNLYPLTPREKLPSRIPEKPRLNSIHFPLEHTYTPEQMRTLELRFLDR